MAAYTQYETAHLIARYPTTRMRVIAQELGRSYASVLQKAQHMGLKRTAKQKSAIYSGWSRQSKRESLPTVHTPSEQITLIAANVDSGMACPRPNVSGPVGP